MIQKVRVKSNDNMDCSWCGYADIASDSNYAFTFAGYDGEFFCSRTCAEEYEADVNED